MDNKQYKYYLPKKNGESYENITENQAVVIIGANGAGKSHLGAWMECSNFDNVHRIGAQRNLNFKDNIELKSYSEAEDIVFFGSADLNSGGGNKYLRWRDNYTTMLVNDFENVLAALIALKNNDNEEFVTQCREAEEQGLPYPEIPLTALDKLQIIWKGIFPQRDLIVKDSRFFAVMEKDGNKIEYLANQMSDGERSALYLIAQVLCVPLHKTLIIDEPEIHLHRSLMNKLWLSLENYRKDCLFIYITHDTQFASLHSHAEKIWIKNYDGENWDFEKIDSTDLPEELLLDILGNRKNVLFVEGESNSYDTRLYSFLYPSYYVIPCGGCSQVIQRTKTFNHNSQLHHCKVYGIIDRDYRTSYEIQKYEKDNIYTLNVAEVENLFLVEPLIRFISQYLGRNSDRDFACIKDYVINQRFKKQLESQICESVVAEIKYKLNTMEISRKSETQVHESLNNVLNSIKYEDIFVNHTNDFRNVLDRGDYKSILTVFNEKDIAKSIGHFLDMKDIGYCDMVINLLNSGNSTVKKEISDAITPYLPSEIKR